MPTLLLLFLLLLLLLLVFKKKVYNFIIANYNKGTIFEILFNFFSLSIIFFLLNKFFSKEKFSEFIFSHVTLEKISTFFSDCFFQILTLNRFREKRLLSFFNYEGYQALLFRTFSSEEINEISRIKAEDLISLTLKVQKRVAHCDELIQEPKTFSQSLYIFYVYEGNQFFITLEESLKLTPNVHIDILRYIYLMYCHLLITQCKYLRINRGWLENKPFITEEEYNRQRKKRQKFKKLRKNEK